MAHHVPRTIRRPVQLRANHSAHIPNRDLHRVGGGALRLPAHVDGGPGQGKGYGGVDSGCGKEGADVGLAGFGCGVGVGEENDVADYGDCGAEQDEGSATGIAFGDDGVDHCEDRGEGLGWGAGGQWVVALGMGESLGNTNVWRDG